MVTNIVNFLFSFLYHSTGRYAFDTGGKKAQKKKKKNLKTRVDSYVQCFKSCTFHYATLVECLYTFLLWMLKDNSRLLQLGS